MHPKQGSEPTLVNKNKKRERPFNITSSHRELAPTCLQTRPGSKHTQPPSQKILDTAVVGRPLVEHCNEVQSTLVLVFFRLDQRRFPIPDAELHGFKRERSKDIYCTVLIEILVPQFIIPSTGSTRERNKPNLQRSTRL